MAEPAKAFPQHRQASPATESTNFQNRLRQVSQKTPSLGIRRLARSARQMRRPQEQLRQT